MNKTIRKIKKWMSGPARRQKVITDIEVSAMIIELLTPRREHGANEKTIQRLARRATRLYKVIRTKR